MKHHQKSQEIHQLAQESHSIALKNFAQLGSTLKDVHGALNFLPLQQLAGRDRILNNTEPLMLEYPSLLPQHPAMVVKKVSARVVEDANDVKSPPSYQCVAPQDNQITFEQRLDATQLVPSSDDHLDNRVSFLEANSVQRSEIQDLQTALRKMQQEMPTQPADQLKAINMFIVPDETNVSKIVRSTLQAVLIRVLDGCVGQYTSWYDRALKELKSMIDEISNMVSRSEKDGWDRPNREIFKRDEYKNHAQVVSQEWYSQRSIGSLTVRISNSRPMCKSKRRGQRLFEVACGFHPDPKVFGGVGVAAMISPQTNRGFSQICPMIAEFGVREDDSPIFEFAGSGGIDNLHRLQDLLQKGLASPNGECSNPSFIFRIHPQNMTTLLICRETLDEWDRNTYSLSCSGSLLSSQC